MHYSQLLKALCVGAAFTLHITASPIPASDAHELEFRAPILGKRTTIELYHVTTAASATSIHTGGVKLQVKPTIGDDFNPKGTGGFYVSDNKEGILNWCKGRQVNAADAKTNCADLITFDFDESVLSSLKVHRFGPTGALSAQAVDTWQDEEGDDSDFNQWLEFATYCTHGGTEPTNLSADLKNGGAGLDLVIGPMVGTETVRQYAFRTTEASAHLKVKTVTKTGI
ncbi:hypothetical protein J3R30DRAFT_3733263 [Lentinula aciculospora]|uniref:Uncharacterized protein n=1 Tax=Lentinula aciculospora TaxID=153920 RepID=A0A9W9DQ21_9AGAR|nr:hypothetical protein J3R30DRAFT_3733263 [Lentinula aciculospora]